MGRDLFGAPTNGKHYDLFGTETNHFRWIVAQFSGNGAVQVIQRANETDLKTYYPIRRKSNGEYIALWSSYLFIQFVEGVTINLCRTTSHFIKIVSERDQDGLIHPILIRKDAINESLKLMTMGKFDDIVFTRRFHGRGTIVRIIDGVFLDKTARLEIDVTPEMRGNTKVPLDINGLKCLIELHKLAL